MLKTVAYYAVILAGLALLVVAALVVPRHPLWLALFAPVLCLWGIWTIREYWKWVRNLGRTD